MLHEHVANQRRDFHHKEAHKLVGRHSLIAVEALNVKGIARSKLAKSTHDAAWAQFVNILVSKAEEAGVRVVAVDPKNTTQACSRCGGLPEVKKKLSDRVHSCPCGYTQDRDINAAENILALGRRVQAQTYRDAERVA
jgi:putative transposase